MLEICSVCIKLPEQSLQYKLTLRAAAVISETVRQQILDRQRRMAAAENAPEMSRPQTAALQRDIAAILLPGESVTRGLQRLGKQDKRSAGLHSTSLLTASPLDAALV